MKKIFIFLLMFIQVLSKKMVLDYGAFLKIEEASHLHNMLVDFKKNYKVEILFITLPNEQKYNCEKSILEEINNNNNIIFIFRSPSAYKIYFHNFNNSRRLSNKMGHVLSSESDNYYKEFINIITFVEKEQIFKYKQPINNVEFVTKEKIIFMIILIIIFVCFSYLYINKSRKHWGIKWK